MSKRVFVLDTNVLMHDPSALFSFQEHDVFIPMTVLEELDNSKKGLSEVARNVRQVSRYFDALTLEKSHQEIEAGLALNNGRPYFNEKNKIAVTGHLLFETQPPQISLPAQLPGDKADNSILLSALALGQGPREREVILVSKDINLRIKAALIGLRAQDYINDQVINDLDLLYSGYQQLGKSFWKTLDQHKIEPSDNGQIRYQVDDQNWHINQLLYGDQTAPELVTRQISDQQALLETLDNYRQGYKSIWGVHARNREQNFAFNLLMDPEVDFVSLLGAAGTGKTLLALAAGLAQTLDNNRYREIIMTRVTVPVGEDIGYLPGTEEEKMTPWMGALMDNLEVLTADDQSSQWEQAATQDLLGKRIKIRSVNFMRGRTFLQRYVILDEAQNLTPKQMKTLITRAGPGTKFVCIGNLSQIDTPYLSETTSGLAYVIERFQHWPHSGHVTLARGERSRLAAFAADTL